MNIFDKFSAMKEAKRLCFENADALSRTDFVDFCGRLLAKYQFKIKSGGRFNAQDVDMVVQSGGKNYAVCCVNFTTDISPLINKLLNVSKSLGCHRQIIISNHYFVGQPLNLQNTASQTINNISTQISTTTIWGNVAQTVTRAIGQKVAPVAPVLIDRDGMYEMMKNADNKNSESLPILSATANIYPPLSDNEIGRKNAVHFTVSRIINFFKVNNMPIKVVDTETVEGLVMLNCKSLSGQRCIEMEEMSAGLASYLGNHNLSITSDAFDNNATICFGTSDALRMMGI